MEMKAEIVDFKIIETTATSIQYVTKETGIDVPPRNTENKSPVMLLQNTISITPNSNLDVGTVIKTEIPDFEIETTPTSIQYIPKATDNLPEKHNIEKETDILTRLSDTLVSPVMSLLSTENRNTDFDVTVKGEEMKTEITDFEIETTPTTIQYVSKATDNFLQEKHNSEKETEILNQLRDTPISPVMSLLSTENRNTDFEVTVEGEEIKTEITDFEIEKTTTTTQYVAKETEKLSTDKQLIDLDKKNVNYSKTPYECEISAIGFFSQDNYDEHILYHSRGPNNGPACSMCAVAFATEQGFILHCRTTHNKLQLITTTSGSSEEQVKPTSNADEVKDTDDAPQDALQENIKFNSKKISHDKQASIEQLQTENIQVKSDKEMSKQNIGMKLRRSSRIKMKAKNVNTNRKFKVKRVSEERTSSEEEVEPTSNTAELTKIVGTPVALKKDSKYELVKRSQREQAIVEQAIVEQPYKCNICQKTFTEWGNLKRHAILHTTAARPYECKVCRKGFARNDNLKIHEKLHRGDKPYKCNTCNKRFKLADRLKRHETLHTGEQPYKCNVCDKKFTILSNLKRHEKLHSGDKPYKCNTCNKRFTLSSSLKRHEILHTGDKPYECNTCNKRFKLAERLKRHETSHSGERPYKCNVCDKKFPHLSNLKRHELLHTGVKPYECKICGKRFTQWSHLNIHNIIHTNDIPFKCKVCHKGFVRKDVLKRHETLHAGDKPNKCEVCHKEFARKYCLRLHERTHNGEKPYQCNICDKRFSLWGNMNNHKRLHTRNK